MVANGYPHGPHKEDPETSENADQDHHIHFTKHGHENDGIDLDGDHEANKSHNASRRGSWIKSRSRANTTLRSRAASMLSLQSIKDVMSKETIMTIWLQSALPFLIAGLGSIGAGQALNQAQQFPLFVHVPQMIAMSTPLMGLKGNLDMTFASRLATMSHQGKLDTWSGIKQRVPINMVLVQAQAIVIALFAAGLTLGLSAIQVALNIKGAPSDDNLLAHVPLMTATGLLTICSSCTFMDTVMAAMVIISRRKNVNPDNITAPIAASMGDLLCMCLLVAYGSVLFIPYNKESTQKWETVPAIAVTSVLMLLWPIWVWWSSKNYRTRQMLKTAWFSLIGSALLSGGAGFILQIAVNSFPEMSLYQPLMAGIAGNRVAVQSSRIASLMYRDHKLGELPEGRSLWRYLSPWRAYLGPEKDAQAARLLLATAVPFQAIFVGLTYLVSYLLHQAGVVDPLPKINWVFTLGYLTAAFFQILILLYCCQLVVFAMWRFKIDPDLHSIPILTGMGDLFGTALSLITYLVIYQIAPTYVRACWDADAKC